MHSVVRIEPAKLILVGTRITYQATRDAGWAAKNLVNTKYFRPPNFWGRTHINAGLQKTAALVWLRLIWVGVRQHGLGCGLDWVHYCCSTKTLSYLSMYNARMVFSWTTRIWEQFLWASCLSNHGHRRDELINPSCSIHSCRPRQLSTCSCWGTFQGQTGMHFQFFCIKGFWVCAKGFYRVRNKKLQLYQVVDNKNTKTSCNLYL